MQVTHQGRAWIYGHGSAASAKEHAESCRKNKVKKVRVYEGKIEWSELK